MDRCLIKCIHEDKVKRIRDFLPDSDTVSGISEIFKALSDPGRLLIVTALLKEELCVCDIAAVAGISESAASHQLRILRNLKIVKYRRDGKIVFYRLDDDHVINLIENSLIHFIHSQSHKSEPL